MLALLAVAVAALVASWNVDNRAGTHCGSWLFPSDVAAAQADAASASEAASLDLRDALLRSGGQLTGERAPYAQTNSQVEACEEARHGRQPATLSLAALAVVLFGVGIAQRRRPATP